MVTLRIRGKGRTEWCHEQWEHMPCGRFPGQSGSQRRWLGIPPEAGQAQGRSRCCLVARSCPTLLQPGGLQPAGLLCPQGFPGKNTGVSCHSLLQGIFPTQGSSPHLLHWQAGKSLPLSHQGSPRGGEWCSKYLTPSRTIRTDTSHKQRLLLS